LVLWPIFRIKFLQIRIYDMLITIAVAIVAGIVGYLSCYWLGNNNPIENECEKIIKDETGADIDLDKPTPTQKS